MSQIFLFSFLFVIGNIVVIRLFLNETRSERSSEVRLALIFSVGLTITVLISFFVPMVLFTNGNIRLPTILVGIISSFIWFVLGYPVARILMKWKKRG